MSGLSLAIVQLEIADGDPAANLDRAVGRLRASPGCGLYLLPELWTTGYAHASWADAADRATPLVLDRLRSLSRELGAWIGGSMVSRNQAGRLVNRFWLCGPREGEPVAYDKAHLFPPMAEDTYLEAGRNRVRVEVGPFTAALSVCFDLRFPEQYRLDAVAGADLFLVVAEWPAARAETMRLLARARAAENQAYLVLCNRVGTGSDGTHFEGGSLVITPTGQVMAEGGMGEETLTAAIEAGAVRAARSTIEVLRVRRPGVDYVTGQ
jgi:predicted amidohydrolase